MKMNGITALDHQEPDGRLMVLLTGTTMEEIVGLDAGKLTFSTDQGDVESVFVGYRLDTVTYNVKDGVFTAVYVRGVEDTTGAVLASMARELADAQSQVRELSAQVTDLTGAIERGLTT